MILATWLVINTTWAVVSLGLYVQAGLDGHRDEMLVMAALFVGSGTAVAAVWMAVVNQLESGSEGAEKTRDPDHQED